MNINDITKQFIPDKKIPKIKSGDIVKITSESGEGGQQIFEGVVIATSGSGADKTFIVRKVAAGVGVEKTYPLYAPTIKKIQVKKSSKVRRAKLYWLRDRVGRSARLTEKDLDPEVIKLMADEEVIKSDSQKVSKKEEKLDKAEEDKEKNKDENKEEDKKSKAEPKKTATNTKDKS